MKRKPLPPPAAPSLVGNFPDTADLHGSLENDRLIAKAAGGSGSNYINITKFGVEITEAREADFYLLITALHTLVFGLEFHSPRPLT